jgi:hypothetical protein
MKKTSSFAIADEYLKSPTAGPLVSRIGWEQIADIDSGTLQAVLIASEILGGPVWFSFIADFDPADACRCSMPMNFAW